MSNWNINPEWSKHNAIYNEGGEGYNPHNKWMQKSATVQAVGRILRDANGNVMKESVMRTKLAELTERISRLTDATAIAITQDTINHYTAQLA
jgi:hypothetical protein